MKFALFWTFAVFVSLQSISFVYADEGCLSISTVSSIHFGWMIPGNSKTIFASEYGAMCFKITGRKGTQVLVTVPTQIQLGSGVTFTRGVVMYSTSSSQSGLISFINSGSTTGIVTIPNTGGGGNQRSVWIWIGGTVSVPQNVSMGNKTASLTVQIQKMDD